MKLTSVFSRKRARPQRAFGVFGLSVALLVPGLPANVQANVYATDLRLNGSTNNITIGPGGSVTINYRLNEDATAGVTVRISSGGTVRRTLSLLGGDPGTARGPNSVSWDGKDDNTNQVISGTYTIQITAAATGYGDWTQLTYDLDSGNYVNAPRGIAVNRNTNSLCYGRVFVANAITGPFGVLQPGDAVGLLKLNADATFATDGAASDGGWPWAGDGASPWKVEVSAEDYVYVGDFNSTNGGAVVRFDQAIAASSQTAVLRGDNWPSNSVRLSGPFISRQGSTTWIWMADTNAVGCGIRRWNVPAGGGIATNDTGTAIVRAGPDSTLDTAPFDVAVDASNRIYTIQSVMESGSLSPRLLRFPAFTNAVETNADWAIGSGVAAMLGASGVAVNPAMTYVAAAFQNGGVGVFSVASGALVTTLGPTDHDYRDVAWDNVGNLYLCDTSSQAWRAFSPPDGANQATTAALLSVQVSAPPASPLLSAPGYTNGQFNFTLTGQANVTYVIQAATDLQPTNLWTSVLTNTAPTAVRPITVPAPAAQSCYRAVVAQ